MRYYNSIFTQHLDRVATTFIALTYLPYCYKVMKESKTQVHQAMVCCSEAGTSLRATCVTPRRSLCTQGMTESWTTFLLTLNIIARTIPCLCLWLLPRNTYIQWRTHLMFFIRAVRVITHASDNLWHGFAVKRLCSYHKIVLVHAQLLINPVLVPVINRLPFCLNAPLELASFGLLIVAAMSSVGLCAQLDAQMNTIQGVGEMNQHVLSSVPLSCNNTHMCMLDTLAWLEAKHGVGSSSAGYMTCSSMTCPSHKGWLRGELADDWPVCVQTAATLDKVC